ncbi:hypothetical protein QQF64_020424 [Cirrhinus molitorella]|uniref:Uncharacterized protein n=1 Tax=Cirrhinus molitorella TaxID=172907 RepID=A0ABR3LCK6_9TELE
MVLRAGKAASMETETDCVRTKHSTRIVKPPRWHQDYVMAQLNPSSHPSGQSSQEPKEMNQLVSSQEASIIATQEEVKSLSEEIKQIKGMLLDVGKTIKGMQRRGSSSFSSSESSLAEESSVPTLTQLHQQDEANAGDSIVDELSALCMPSKGQSILPPSQYVPSVSAVPTTSATTTELSEIQHLQPPNPCVFTRPSVPLTTSDNFRTQSVDSNVMGAGLTQQCNGPPWSSSVSHYQMNPSFYSSNQQAGRDQSFPHDQMQGNAFSMPGFPWMPPSWPTFFSSGVPRPPYIPDFPYPVVYPSHSQLVSPNCTFPRVVTLPSRDLLAEASHASLGHPPQAISQLQTRTSVNQVNPPVQSIQSPLMSTNISASVPQMQQGDVNPPVALSPNGTHLALPQHMSIPPAVTVPNVMMSALQPSRSAYIERLSFPYLKSDDPHEFAMLNMALKNLMPPDETEQYKYHILLDHLKFDAARYLALAYAHHSQPYTSALKALQKRYGQPHHLVLRELTAIKNLPAVRLGDSVGFGQFAVRVQALVGMLQSWDYEGAKELSCASHVHQLLSKLPAPQVASFARYAKINRPDEPYDLIIFSIWLEEESECQNLATQVFKQSKGVKVQSRDGKPMRSQFHTAAFLHRVNQEVNLPTQRKKPGVTNSESIRSQERKGGHKSLCAYCCSNDHHLSHCSQFQSFDIEAKRKWIVDHNRCWRCGWAHRSSKCDLQGKCLLCRDRHLGVLHEVNIHKSDSGIFYLSRPSGPNSVLLKIVKVILNHQGKTLETYAILDDGENYAYVFCSRDFGSPRAGRIIGPTNHPARPREN